MNKHTIEMIKLLEGQELYYSDWGIVMVEFPYVWCQGKKVKLTENQWKELVKDYSENIDNDGYWALKDAEKEFGVLQ